MAYKSDQEWKFWPIFIYIVQNFAPIAVNLYNSILVASTKSYVCLTKQYLTETAVSFPIRLSNLDLPIKFIHVSFHANSTCVEMFGSVWYSQGTFFPLFPSHTSFPPGWLFVVAGCIALQLQPNLLLIYCKITRSLNLPLFPGRKIQPHTNLLMNKAWTNNLPSWLVFARLFPLTWTRTHPLTLSNVKVFGWIFNIFFRKAPNHVGWATQIKFTILLPIYN